MLTILSDIMLIEAYQDARALDLEVEFILLLAEELKRRGLSLKEEQESNENKH